MSCICFAFQINEAGVVLLLVAGFSDPAPRKQKDTTQIVKKAEPTVKNARQLAWEKLDKSKKNS